MQKTTGTVLSVKTQLWLKVNTKSLRKGPLDGATFPHIVKVRYTAGGKEYTKRKWVSAGVGAPAEGSTVIIVYDENKPGKCSIELGRHLNEKE